MFILSTVHDTIKVKAAQLHSDITSVLTYNINAKYANRVLPNVGLCVAHFDYISISEGHIKYGDGCTYYKATFRLVVFRPFKGQVLVGRIKSSDEMGIRVTLGFFDDIYVTWDALPVPSGYDQSEATWFWVAEPGHKEIYDDPLLSGKADRHYFDKGEPVRFLVEDDQFNEPEPPGPRANKSTSLATQSVGGENVDIDSANRIPPYKIKVGRPHNVVWARLTNTSYRHPWDSLD